MRFNVLSRNVINNNNTRDTRSVSPKWFNGDIMQTFNANALHVSFKQIYGKEHGQMEKIHTNNFNIFF